MGKSCAVTVVGLAAILAGCAASPSSISESDFRGGLPSEAITADPDTHAKEPYLSLGPAAGWLDAGAKFAVALSGSSSCPAFPSSIQVLNSQHVKLEVATHDAQACTADLAPHTYVIKTPADVDSSREVTLDVGETRVLLPPLPR